MFKRKLEVLGVSVATSRSNPLSKRKLDKFELPHGVAGAIRGVVGGDRGEKPSYFGVVTDQAIAPWWLAVAEGLRAAPSWVLGATVGKAVDWGEATRSVSYLDTWEEVRTVSNQAATIFFETGGPVPSSAVWTLPGVTTVVWTTQSSRERYKFRFPKELKTSWTEHTLMINHITLGGVIDQVQEFKVATQNGSAPIKWIRQLGLDASLDQILDCKVLGNTAPAPKPGHPSGDKERLQVKQLAATLLVPCVKSSTGWVRRKLTPKELAKAFDVPAWLVQNLTEEVLGELFGGKPITSFKSHGYIVSAILETSGNLEGRQRDLLDHVRDAHPIPAIRALDAAQPRNTLLPAQPEKAPQVPAMQSEASTEGRSKEGAKADSASVPIFIWDHKVGLDRGRSGKHKDVSKEQIRKALLTRESGSRRMATHPPWY